MLYILFINGMLLIYQYLVSKTFIGRLSAYIRNGKAFNNAIIIYKRLETGLEKTIQYINHS